MQNTFAPSLPTALLNAFNTNNRINHYLIDHLPAAAWKASPPEGKGRTIQAIVAHMHNVRVVWLTSAKDTQSARSCQGHRAAGFEGSGAEPRSSQRSLGPSHHGRRPRQRFSSRRQTQSAFSLILSPMTLTIADKLPCLPAKWGIPFRRKSCSACGNGIGADFGVASQTFSA